MSRDTTAANQAALERMAVALERIAGLLAEIDFRLRLDEYSGVGGRSSALARWARRRQAAGVRMDEPTSPRTCLPLAYRAVDRISIAAATRDHRPWLGIVGVALAVTAVMLAGRPWLLLPLAGCAWWWSSDEWRWTWLTSLLGGLLGAAWVSIGLNQLAAAPGSLIAELPWVVAPLAVAGLGVVLRRVVSDD